MYIHCTDENKGGSGRMGLSHLAQFRKRVEHGLEPKQHGPDTHSPSLYGSPLHGHRVKKSLDL